MGRSHSESEPTANRVPLDPFHWYVTVLSRKHISAPTSLGTANNLTTYPADLVSKPRGREVLHQGAHASRDETCRLHCNNEILLAPL
jgi:hypothetical protein